VSVSLKTSLLQLFCSKINSIRPPATLMNSF
jgi:hypothetical protein